MSSAQLLCTFTKLKKLEKTIELITETYDIAFGKIYILENKDNKYELMCTYNIKTRNEPGRTVPNTISIHRKKNTNTLYTINALNNIVVLLNDGELDPNFQVDWNNYRNSLLVTDENGLKQINTKIFDIVELE